MNSGIPAFWARADLPLLLWIAVIVAAKLDEIAVRVAQVDALHGAACAMARDNAGFGGRFAVKASVERFVFDVQRR